ncbi:MAG: hypothetical protein ACYC1E_18885, partial [Propionibacteriaceae bacterium]
MQQAHDFSLTHSQPIGGGPCRYPTTTPILARRTDIRENRSGFGSRYHEIGRTTIFNGRGVNLRQHRTQTRGVDSRTPVLSHDLGRGERDKPTFITRKGQ